MERSSRNGTAAFARCRSAVGADSTPADAWSSSRAGASRTGTRRSHLGEASGASARPAPRRFQWKPAWPVPFWRNAGRSRCRSGLAAVPTFPSPERPGPGRCRRVSPTCSFRGHLATSADEFDALRDAASYGLNRCLDAVLEVKLGEDPGDVVGDGVRAQREVSRDLVIALAAGELLEDLELAVGQGSADGDRGNGAGLDGDV